MAAFDSAAFDTAAFDTAAFDLDSDGTSDDGGDWRLRDAMNRRRFSWSACIALILLAGCHTQRSDISPCLGHDVGQVMHTCR